MKPWGSLLLNLSPCGETERDDVHEFVRGTASDLGVVRGTAFDDTSAPIALVDVTLLDATLADATLADATAPTGTAPVTTVVAAKDATVLTWTAPGVTAHGSRVVGEAELDDLSLFNGFDIDGPTSVVSCGFLVTSPTGKKTSGEPS